MIKSQNYNQGFSLIEMIVSLGIFAIVVTTAVGALIVVISNNQKLQAEQVAMANLSFALDSMTREIRMGYNYYCEGRPNYSSGGPNNIFYSGNNPESIIGESVKDCVNGAGASDKIRGVSFYEGGDSLTGGAAGRNHITYYYDYDAKKIYRRVSDDPAQSIMSSDLDIVDARFYVSGSETFTKNSGSADLIQPTVTIYIEAKSAGNINGKTYKLQTTVSQRTLDI